MPMWHKRVLVRLRAYLRSLFSLHLDTDIEGTIDGIKRSIDFRGENVWALVFAIFIASIGLNVNSTAVIIGAMLISPLMGPIIGVGFALGTNDVETFRRSLRSLAVMVAIGLLTSALYFLATPLKEAQSELLARTQPTIYDVLIALFGGATGIVAGTRKERGNAIPGVAIATALMPPLCTAGYGLATFQWSYFFGAFYLFLINSVFIALATLVFVHYLHFPKHPYLDPAQERRARQVVTWVAILTILPSVYIAWGVVQEAVFRGRATRFIEENLDYENRIVVNSEMQYRRTGSQIEVTLVGEPLPQDTVEALRGRLAAYQLGAAHLTIRQSTPPDLREQLRLGLLEDLYERNEAALQSREDRIRLLEAELLRYQARAKPVTDITRELRTLYPNLSALAYEEVVRIDAATLRPDTLPTVLVSWTEGRRVDLRVFEQFLRARLQVDTVQVIAY
jgi:uncharacterized hydrophobic protein (TIGR00271 family)